MKTNPFLVFSLMLGILAVVFLCTIKLSHHTIKPQAKPDPPAPTCYVYMSPNALERRGDEYPPPPYSSLGKERGWAEYERNWHRFDSYPATQVITPKVITPKKLSTVQPSRCCRWRHHRCVERCYLRTAKTCKSHACTKHTVTSKCHRHRHHHRCHHPRLSAKCHHRHHAVAARRCHRHHHRFHRRHHRHN